MGDAERPTHEGEATRGSGGVGGRARAGVMHGRIKRGQLAPHFLKGGLGIEATRPRETPRGGGGGGFPTRTSFQFSLSNSVPAPTDTDRPGLPYRPTEFTDVRTWRPLP